MGEVKDLNTIVILWTNVRQLGQIFVTVHHLHLVHGKRNQYRFQVLITKCVLNLIIQNLIVNMYHL